MKQNHRWTAAIPMVRLGMLMFPGGFRDGVLCGCSPRVPPRISRDWAFNAGIFFDLEGLFQ
jgi:hypothetical protein